MALEHASLTEDLGKFFEACFKESGDAERLSECIYEAIETCCGIRTSLSGYLGTSFVLNAMNIASVVKGLTANASEDAQA